MSSTSSVTSASDIQMDYMKLLVAQLQYQNPLDPLDNQEMASQLAQFSQLEQLESMNSAFQQVLVSVERNYGSSLVGREVSFLAETDGTDIGVVTGTVEQVYNDVDGEVFLVTDEYQVSLQDIVSVGD